MSKVPRCQKRIQRIPLVPLMVNLQCIVDSSDPTGACEPCKRRNIATECGPRTWPEGTKVSKSTEVANRYDLMKWSEDSNSLAVLESLKSELVAMKASVVEIQKTLSQLISSRPNLSKGYLFHLSD